MEGACANPRPPHPAPKGIALGGYDTAVIAFPRTEEPPCGEEVDVRRRADLDFQDAAVHAVASKLPGRGLEMYFWKNFTRVAGPEAKGTDSRIMSVTCPCAPTLAELGLLTRPGVEVCHV